jgi:hypothetical protein
MESPTTDLALGSTGRRPPWWASLALCVAALVILAAAVYCWTRGWLLPALLVAVLGLSVGWAWFDNQFVYTGKPAGPPADPPSI